MDRQLDRARDEDDEEEDLRRVDERGDENALVRATAAVAVFAEVMDVQGPTAHMESGADPVHKKADGNRRADLQKDNPHEDGNGNLLGQENGQELVGRREENGEKRPAPASGPIKRARSRILSSAPPACASTASRTR